MSQALSEEEKQYIQRFDTPVIRDFDFPPESGNRAMPYETEQTAIAAEPSAGVQAPLSEPEADPAVTIYGLPVPPEETAATQEPPAAAQPLDPASIPKFVNQLTKPPVFSPVNPGNDEYLYVIDITRFKQQMLPEGFPETTVWGYCGSVMDEETRRLRRFTGTPGATIEAVRNMPVSVRWVNKLSGAHLMDDAPADRGADTEGDGRAAPVVTRLNGAAMAASGQPDAWSVCNTETGSAHRTLLNTYPNRRDAATLWYHDNAGDISRANIYAGLAGFYLLRSGAEFTWQRDGALPKGRYEIPLIIQDRSFNTDGSLSFSRDGVNPFKRGTGFLGDAITVNGKVWPNLNAERRQYRFRLLNGSETRVYNLRMSNGMAFTQIGTGAGFLPEPGIVDSLRLAPGACADVLVDFSALEPGTAVILLNASGFPFSNKDASDPETTGQIMRFTIPPDAPEPVIPKKLPKKLR